MNEEKLRKQEEEHLLAEKRRIEEENALDPETLEIINQKIKLAEEEIKRKLETRENSLNDKLDAINPKRKK